jgi:hypothetical protein
MTPPPSKKGSPDEDPPSGRRPAGGTQSAAQEAPGSGTAPGSGDAPGSGTEPGSGDAPGSGAPGAQDDPPTTEDDPPADDAPAAGGPPVEVSTAAVNQQIMGAVQATTDFAFGLTAELNAPGGTSRLSAGVAIAYDKVAQAAALGIQDATDYERNILSISSAAQGKALALILAGDTSESTIAGFILALVAAVAAPIVVAEVGFAQTFTLKNFPQA